ncbi:MAG TPA: NADH-quinone oxidoreductase subunit M [Thermoanaerobaculia bacterium]|nr:NADH-quinone oxidoreductase subunit M [Thermoanaerobaculia bacterium]
MPLLSILIWLPIAAAIVLAFFPKTAVTAIKGWGLFSSAAVFVISLGLLRGWDDARAGFQFVERKAWIPQWGINYALGIDGISLWLVLLTTFLTPIIFLSAWNAIHKHPKEYVISFLIMETAMIGAFIATDLILFYVFFELMLLPMYLVIGVWGGANRIYAAIKFFLFTIAGSLLMLLGIIYLGFQSYHQTGIPTFDITQLYGTHLPAYAQMLLFFAFSLAFAIKVPLFPLHTWLPDAHVEAPTGGSIILAGVMLKMGTYGFLRFVLPFFPESSVKYAPLMITLSVIGIIYGALVAWVQPDMKKLVAYSSVSHLGFCVLGIFAMNETAITGSILQMVNHGISTGALFLLVGVVYERRHTRLLADYGGLGRAMPVYATFFVIAVLSSVGLPGLNGFVGEFLILAGSFKAAPTATVIAATGVILAAIYLLWLVQKVFFGPVTNEENRNVPDIAWNEIAAMVPLVILMVWIGVHPGTFLRKMEPSVKHLLTTIQRTDGKIMVASSAGFQPAVSRASSPRRQDAGATAGKMPALQVAHGVILSREDGEGSSGVPPEKILRSAQDDTAAEVSR